MESAAWNVPARNQRKPNASPRTSAAKIKFRLYLAPDHRCPEKRFWLKHNGFSGKCDNHLRRVCPVDGDTARRLYVGASSRRAP